MPFQVGLGTNGLNATMGASAPVNFEHVLQTGEIIGSLSDHLESWYFQMDLMPLGGSTAGPEGPGKTAARYWQLY